MSRMEEYTEERASRYEPLMWAGSGPVSPKPHDLQFTRYCNTTGCIAQETPSGYCPDCELQRLKAAKRGAALKALALSFPARAFVFVMQWGGVGIVFWYAGLRYWQVTFYLALIPAMFALAFLKAWQRKHRQ